MGRPEARGLHPIIDDAFARSPLVVLEVDVSAFDPLDLLDLMDELGRLPEGRSLESQVSRDTWALLRDHCEQEGCDLAAFNRLEPWLVALQLVGTAMTAEGLAAEHGVERQILADLGDKEILALETPREQFELFDGLPAPQQELMLRDALVPTVSSTDELEALFEAWRHGDATTLETILFGELEGAPELAPFYEAAFFQRNLRMAAGIEDLLADEPYVFVVLGAGHLVGARGVPALLERAGHAVHQVGPAVGPDGDAAEARIQAPGTAP